MRTGSLLGVNFHPCFAFTFLLESGTRLTYNIDFVLNEEYLALAHYCTHLFLYS